MASLDKQDTSESAYYVPEGDPPRYDSLENIDYMDEKPENKQKKAAQQLQRQERISSASRVDRIGFRRYLDEKLSCHRLVIFGLIVLVGILAFVIILLLNNMVRFLCLISDAFLQHLKQTKQIEFKEGKYVYM